MEIDLFRRRGVHAEFPSIADRIDASGDCWEWKGKLNHGYGRTSLDGTMWYVHRLVWVALVGPIPEGMEVDHLCRNRKCCNPDHCQVVTHKENVRRGETGRHESVKTHCPQGHPYSGGNLYLSPTNGSRSCRTCKREWAQRDRDNRKAST